MWGGYQPVGGEFLPMTSHTVGIQSVRPPCVHAGSHPYNPCHLTAQASYPPPKRMQTLA